MKQFYGMSQRGSLDEALQGLYNPQFIMLLSNDAQFEEHVQALEKRYPGIPSIGCIGMSYQTGVVEHGVGIIAFSDGVTAAANVLEQVSTMPVKYIQRLERDMQTVGGSSRDTVCIDFCAGNDACVLTTIYTALRQRGISLVGGTGDQGKVSANGRVYQDAVAYALVRNQSGRVKTYKENIYHQLGNYRFIASNTDRSNYILGSLNGKPAKQVYKSILHVTDEEILTRTFQNPFGKINGDDTCIISIKEVHGNSLACFRQVNDSDVLILLELGDYQACCEGDHCPALPGLPPPLGHLLRQLPVPLQAVFRAQLYADLPAGDGLSGLSRGLCRVWRALQQPLCQPVHDLRGL